jgi:hypothetical protein
MKIAQACKLEWLFHLWLLFKWLPVFAFVDVGLVIIYSMICYILQFFTCSFFNLILNSLQLQKFREELKNRSRVLKRLGHIDADGVVQVKGRAACLIDTGDELLVTELMFNGELMTIIFLSLIFHALQNLILPQAGFLWPCCWWPYMHIIKVEPLISSSNI